MAAVAPFLVESSEASGPFQIGEPAGADGGAADLWQQYIGQHNLELARQQEIPDSVRLLVEELADQVAALPEAVSLRVDPYLVVAAQRALIGSMRALDSDDLPWARRQMRVRLEQLRQVFRDVAEGGPLYEDQPAKEVARWLVSVVDVPHARLASLLGVSPRTFQRWVSETDMIAPEGDDARRVRVIAAAVNQLRHALTGPGAIAWFERPHPRLDGARPLDLVDELDAPSQLTALAASARSNTAT